MPPTVSWSVSATAASPSSAASAGIRAGASVPSLAVLWLCKSIYLSLMLVPL